MYRYQLEKGTKKHTCPGCGERRRFRRVVDTVTGEYLPEHVGRCDRENSCGYVYTSKDYFRDNGDGPLTVKPLEVPKVVAVKYDYHDPSIIDNLAPHFSNDDNHLTSFLRGFFRDEVATVDAVLKAYRVGTFWSKYKVYTLLPYIDQRQRVARGKLIQFDPFTGKRSKERFGTSSLRYELGLPDSWNYDTRVFFGEHLLNGRVWPVGVVESEKTAIIAAIKYPGISWIATGTKGSLNYRKLRRIAGNRVIILYPDGDAYDRWNDIAEDCQRQGLPVRVSQVVREYATPEEQASGFDIADLILNWRLEHDAEREAIQLEGCNAL